MIDGKKVLAIITARGGSKGLPGKNIKLLNGLPLVAYPIKAALNSKYVDRVIVTTDDPNIAQIARDYGAEAPFIRPSELAKDLSPSSDAILHALNYCIQQDGKYSYFVLLEPTSPLTVSLDIDQALEKLLFYNGLAVVGVAKVEKIHPEHCATIESDHFLKPYLRESFSRPSRRQDLSNLYYFEGSLYISEVNKYLISKTFYHEYTLPYIVPDWKSIEIDTLLDFLMVETVLKNIELFEEG